MNKGPVRDNPMIESLEKMLTQDVDNVNCSSYPQLTAFNTSAFRPVDAF